MTDISQQPARTALGRAATASCLIAVLAVAAGLAAGLIWAAVAPRVVYQVASMHPPTAYATNPETSAFIAADGCYCLLAVIGGALVGVAGYLIGVRRHGPLPMAAIVAGSTAAAFLSAWLGHRQSGAPGFSALLADSQPGALLRAPITLGSHGAMAFWPLAAAAVAGGIELAGVLRSRHQAAGVAAGEPWAPGFGAGALPGGPYPYSAAAPAPAPWPYSAAPPVQPAPPAAQPEPGRPAPPRLEP